MIKKLLLGAALVLGVFTSNAQCTINTSFTSPGFSPDSLTGIPVAIVGNPYSTDMQFRVPQDTVLFGFTLSIDSAVLGTIVGLPTGFTTSTNPVSGTILGNSNGCINITGVATSGQEVGGINSDGVYPLAINYTLYVTVPFVGLQAIPQLNTDYRLVVIAPVGLNSVLKNQHDVVAYPNPANDQLNIDFVSFGSKNYTMEVYNYMGQLVSKQDGSAKEGVNNLKLGTSSLPSGTYMYSIRLANGRITKTISITH